MSDPIPDSELTVDQQAARPPFEYFRTLCGDLVKRAFDAVAAALGLLLLSPALVLVGLRIRRDSPGPVFYRGSRVGRNGRVFQIVKLRTMYERPESYDGPRVTSKDDTRITPLGQWLRATKVNELPQLWNVLVGDMSLVGPRPEDPEVIRGWPEEARGEVLSVRPGVTSPASVLYHSEQDMLLKTNLMGTYFKDILPDKLRLDQLYVRNRSFWSDLDIIFWTMTILVPRIARAEIPEGYLFAGPFSRLIHRYVTWFCLDLFVALTAVSTVGVLWRSQAPLNWGLEYLILFALGIAILFSTVNSVAGLNRIVWAKAPAENAIGLFLSSGFVTALAVLLDHFQSTRQWLPFPALPVDMIIFTGIAANLGFVSIRYRFRLIAWVAESWLTWRRDAVGMGERVVILGDGEVCQIAHWLLRRGMFRHAFSVIGIVASEDPTLQGMRLHGCWVLGGIGNLSTLIKRHDVRMVVYAIPNTAEQIRSRVFGICKDSNVSLVFLDDLLAIIDRHLERPAAASEYMEWLQRRTDTIPMHDHVTGLPGAQLLQERLRHSLAYARRYSTTPAVMFIELNGLDFLRTAQGPHAEEDLLKEVTGCLKSHKRDCDTLARLKTDVFAMLFENIPNEAAAETVVRRMGASMSQPFLMRGRELHLTTTISIALPDEDMEAVRLLRACDLGDYYAGWRKQPNTKLEHLVALPLTPDQERLRAS